MSDFASRKVGTDEDEALYRASLSFSILVLPHFSETTLTQCKDSSFKPPAHYIPICFTDETLGGQGGLSDEDRRKEMEMMLTYRCGHVQAIREIQQSLVWSLKKKQVCEE